MTNVTDNMNPRVATECYCVHDDQRAQDALRSVSTAPSMFALFGSSYITISKDGAMTHLRCRAATITSLCKSGKMFMS